MRIYAALLLWLAGSASAGNCGIIYGEPISPAYTGQYTYGPTAAIDFYVVGTTAFASLRLIDGRWYEGTAYVQPNELALLVQMVGPVGTAELLMCAMTKRTDGKITATVFLDGYQQVGPHRFDKVL